MSRCHRSKRPARRYKTQCAGSKLPRTPLCTEQATSPPVEQLVHWVWNFKSQRTFSTFSMDIGLVYSSFPQTFVLHLQLSSTDIGAITDSYFTSPHHNRILMRRLHSLSEGNNTVWTERSLKLSPSHKVVEDTWIGKRQLEALTNWGRTYEFIGKMEFTGELPKTSQVGFTIHIQNEWLPVVTAWLAVYKESSG